MRAFVTGMGGFVGAHLAAWLVADGWDVAGTVRPGSGTSRLAALGLDRSSAVEVVEADLSDPASTAAATGAASAAADVAFLLAASRSGATPADRARTVAVNATGVAWVVDALGDGCRTVVRLGSSTEYGEADGPLDESSPVQPRGFFGATKAAGSVLLPAMCARTGRRAVVLRAFQVYGPLDHPGRLVPTALAAALTGEALALTGPGRRRDWVFVDDVVEACVRAATAAHLPNGQVLNVGTGRQVANEELVELVGRVTGRPVDVRPGAHPGRDWDAASWVCDPSRARDLLGWEAKVALDDGLGRCWDAVDR